jgi:hypothetical protein
MTDSPDSAAAIHVLGALALIAGRIDGFEAYQVAADLHELGFLYARQELLMLVHCGYVLLSP